jgi:hypothetical protein
MKNHRHIASTVMALMTLAALTACGAASEDDDELVASSQEQALGDFISCVPVSANPATYDGSGTAAAKKAAKKAARADANARCVAGGCSQCSFPDDTGCSSSASGFTCTARAYCCDP